ncbi:MAG: metallopeptidase TldD-related protein [Acidimicrobiales bacterium]
MNIDYVDQLVSKASQKLSSSEVLLVSVSGEESDFVRFNHSQVRQAGSVSQMYASIDLSEGQRHTSMTLGLCGDAETDTSALDSAVATLRAQRATVPDDPYFMYATDTASSSHSNPGSVPDGKEIVDLVTASASDVDLVGIWAAGRQYSAFASSLGQRNWFESTTFNLDWSVYLRADKATKQQYAGFDWSADVFAAKLAQQTGQLEALGRAPVELAPGDYRAYLAPSAVSEIMSMLSWGGFGLRSHRSMDSPLIKMTTEGRTMSPAVTIIEDVANGVSPNFGEQGFTKPSQVQLIVEGQYRDHLVSPRSAREYEVDTNGAPDYEAPSSIAMNPGSLDTADAMDALGTGLYVPNLWYLNFSDRSNCRLTGMTRFATFWVEGGEVVAPVTPMRFDDTAFALLGDKLEALGSDAELMLDPSSYGARSTESFRLPAMLVNGMRFTL